MFNAKKLLAIVVVLSSIFIAVGCSSNQATVPDQSGNQAAPQAQGTYQTLTAEQAKQLLDSDKTVQLIDVDEPYEFAQIHIPGAKSIPLSEFGTRVGEIDPSKPVLIYCYSGVRSPQVAEALAQSGYSNVYHLENGVSQWPYEVAKQ